MSEAPAQAAPVKRPPRLQVRLSARQWEILDRIRGADDPNAWTHDPAEFVLLLMMREYNRRFLGTSKVDPADYQTEFRRGRPRKDRPEPSPLPHKRKGIRSDGNP